jgi:hypothetical protein
MNLPVSRAGSPRATPATPAADLVTLAQRAHVRVALTGDLKVYARLKPRAGAGPGWRGVLRDVSTRGMGVDLVEAGRFDPPREGDELVAELEHEGTRATIEGVVTRAGTHVLGVRLRHTAAHDDEVDGGLLALLAHVAARRLARIERAAPPEHFVGPGQLDLRVDAGEPAWWQLVFLEFVVSWSGEEGLSTGLRPSRFAVDADALSEEAHLVRHERPWRSLCKMALQVAARCAAAQPRHAASFGLVEATARSGA